jgi:hypothetical protein
MARPLASVRPQRQQVTGPVVRQCRICRSGELSYEFIVDGCPVCRCAQCSMLFLNPQPGAGGDPAGEASAPRMEASVYELHAANAGARLDHLQAYAGPGLLRLLMIANDGFLTDEATRRGLDVVSVSSDEAEAGALSNLTGEAFDGAVFYCTLERLRDPEAALAQVKRRLRTSGAVMVIAPTIDSRTARLFRSAWWEFTRRNLHYFSADTLQCLLLKSGFGDPIIGSDDSSVSLEYFRAKIPAVSSRLYRLGLTVLVLLTPPFLRRRAFRSLNSRRVLLARSKPMASTPTLSVIVPAFNEKATLSVIMDRLIDKSIDGVAIEIVLVESNSQDGTREEARRYDAHPRVRLILEDRPRGKGHAVRTGLAACTGDVVLIQDADLEYDIEDYDDLIAPLLAYRRNFVIGSRHTSNRAAWKIRQFNEASILATVFNLGHVFFLGLFNFMYRQRLQDPFSMFKVFRRECLYGLTFECNRFDFDFEIVIKLLRKGYQPIELPVNYRARSPGEGKKVSMVRDPLTWIRALVKFRTSPLYSVMKPRETTRGRVTG